MSSMDPRLHVEQTDSPLVSIIVPVYNVEAYVGDYLFDSDDLISSAFIECQPVPEINKLLI